MDSKADRGEEEHSYYTRVSWNVSIQCARTNYKRFSLFCKGPVTWYKIPPYILEAKTVASFKKVWKLFLIVEVEVG